MEKHYSVFYDETGMHLAHDGQIVLGDIYFDTAVSRQGSRTSYPTGITEKNGDTVISFSGEYLFNQFDLILHEERGVLTFSLALSMEQIGRYDDCNYFLSDRTVKMHFTFTLPNDGSYWSSCKRDKYWQWPYFDRDLTQMQFVTQFLMVKSGSRHFCFLPLPTETCRTEMAGTAVELSSGFSALRALSGTFFTLSVGSDPYETVHRSFVVCRDTGAIRVPLKKERELPDFFRTLGWCTWNAFYTDVTADKIFQKLEEFKAKKIPVKWVIIDDGWMQTDNDGRLCSFAEDRSKFEEGLGACVERMKREYGISQVGVWHAFTGYWRGIQPGSELDQKESDNIVTNPVGLRVISPEQNRQFAFFDHWYSYLKEQGIDFVKVDNQSQASYYYDEMMPTQIAVAGAHNALEAAVQKHFNGAMINCMGGNMQDTFSRTSSAINRNSCDFVPLGDWGFYNHLWDNVYTTLFHDQIHVCDLDMWWSKHPYALHNAILRAMGDGPIYTSDPTDGSDLTYIAPLCDEDGRLIQCDCAPMPTVDCLYENRIQEDEIMKLFSVCADGYVVAAYTKHQGTLDGSFCMEDIPAISGHFLAQEYATGKWQRFDADHPLAFFVDHLTPCLWNLYPICDGKIMAGDSQKYIGLATKRTEQCVKTLLGE